MTNSRSIPSYRRATDEVRKLSVSRKFITKRVTSRTTLLTTTEVKKLRGSRLPKGKRIMSITTGYKNLLEFNPPEVDAEVFKLLVETCGDIPSPKFGLKEISLIDESSNVDDDEDEYFRFDPNQS